MPAEPAGCSFLAGLPLQYVDINMWQLFVWRALFCLLMLQLHLSVLDLNCSSSVTDFTVVLLFLLGKPNFHLCVVFGLNI